jgi:ribosomal protein S6E (S10)
MEPKPDATRMFLKGGGIHSGNPMHLAVNGGKYSIILVDGIPEYVDSWF